MEKRKAEVVGACIVSAASSFPLHLMSLLVALVALDGRLPIERAGWISSSFMLGLLAGTVGLPLSGVTRVTPFWAAAAPVIVGSGLGLGAFVGGAYLLAGWVIVGAAAGMLSLLGSTAAATYRDAHFVFSLRLALVLFSSAVAIAMGAALGGFRSYGNAVSVLGIAFAGACAAGLVWYRAPEPRARSREPRQDTRRRLYDLLIVALFFCGQTGFSSYAAHLAIANGIDAGSLPPVYAFCKTAAAAILLRLGLSGRSVAPSLWLGALLGMAVVSMALSTGFAQFAVGLLCWEIALNLQSTRMQATIVSRHPAFAGAWIPAAVAFGAALGPVAHGLLLSVTGGMWFVLYTVASGMLPAIALKPYAKR
ncbi:hypothetical protein AB4Z46_30665 [Variovorax sp. M-6]|uniref:hypothetical protein n=1 Tax=Variovorax sp. M-6 TaxID=3233041 RepID=UPI003F965D73